MTPQAQDMAAREELRRLAEAATPGPWQSLHNNGTLWADGDWIAQARGSFSVRPATDAAYIAAANPAAILRLLASHDALEARVRRLTEALEEWRSVAESRLAVGRVPDWMELLPMTLTALYGDGPIPLSGYEIEAQDRAIELADRFVATGRETQGGGERECGCTADTELAASSVCAVCGHRDHGRSGCRATVSR